MQAALTILIDGVTYASWLFIVALGLTLVFGVLKILNIAHGSFYALGAYAAASFVGSVSGATTAATTTAASFTGRPASLHAMFERSRRTRPDADAIVCDGRRWSYAQAASEADRLSAAFASQGVGAGDRVLMLLGNRPEFLTVLLTLQRLGAIAVPVGVREQRPGLAYIANQCGATAIVFDDELEDRAPDAGEAPALTLRIAASSLAALAASARATPDAAPTRETDVAVILYTSGTTGRPKGAVAIR